MIKKSFLQLTIISLVILISVAFYRIYFSNKIKNQNNITSLKIETKKDIDTSIKGDVENNLIENLEYKSSDSFGNKYFIKSKFAEAENNSLVELKLTSVSATIYLKNRNPINIYSDFAKHDKSSFNTKFYKNVKINYEDLNVNSENLDLFYDRNFVSLYNIKKATNNNAELIADNINIDILTKDVSINMNKNNEKIKIIYK